MIMAGAGGVTGGAALNSEAGSVAATGLTSLTAVFGWRFVIATFIAAIPALIIGLLLTRRRSVWRCTQCGYAYDRT